MILSEYFKNIGSEPYVTLLFIIVMVKFVFVMTTISIIILSRISPSNIHIDKLNKFHQYVYYIFAVLVSILLIYLFIIKIFGVFYYFMSKFMIRANTILQLKLLLILLTITILFTSTSR